MVFRKPVLCCLALAVSKAYCQQSHGESPGSYRCPSDLVKLERGGMVEVFSPNANISCTSADITLLTDNSTTLPRISIIDGNVPCDDFPMQYISLPGNVSTGEAKISWNCGGEDIYCRIVHIGDPATTGTAVLTPIISQTCIVGSHLPSGTVQSQPCVESHILTSKVGTSLTTASTGTVITGAVPTSGSIVPTTQGIGVTGSATMPPVGLSTGPPTELPTELPTDHVTGLPSELTTAEAQGPTPSSILTTDPTGTGGHDGGGAVPSMSHSSDPSGPSTTTLDLQTTAPGGSTAPANPTLTQDVGSASVPAEMATSTKPTANASQTCTCQNS